VLLKSAINLNISKLLQLFAVRTESNVAGIIINAVFFLLLQLNITISISKIKDKERKSESTFWNITQNQNKEVISTSKH
jgi:hypothetical protein